MKRGLKITLWIVGAVLALTVLATLLVGPVAKSYVNSHGEELVGRKLYVDGLHVNVYRGHVALRGLTLYEDDGQTPFASFDTLDVRARLLPLLAHTVHIKHITLSGLEASILRSGDRFNFQSLIDHFASDEPKTDTTPSDWVVKLYNIRLTHAQLHYRDGAQQWHVPDINVRVPGFVIGGDEGSEGGLNLAFTHGGRLNIDADYQGSLGNYALQATLTDFALRNIEPLLAGKLQAASFAGTLGASLRAQGNLDSLMASRISGTVALRNLALRDTTGPVAALDQLNLHVAEINIAAGRYDISRIQLDGLDAHFQQYPNGNTLTRLLPQKDTTATPNTTTTATDITTGGDNNARLRATLPGGGTLTARWNGNIDHWKQRQQLFLSLKGLDMRQLSPWTVYYTGQPIEDGIFGLTTHLDINNSILDNQNKIDIFKATVGNRRTDVTPQQKLPLKTALYILKDKDDKILIDLPVKGNIDSPEFNYMKLVWKTLGQLLVKVATSPARALAGALGLKSDNLDFILLKDDQRGLTSEQYHVLADLATIAKSDSLLTINLELRLPDADPKRTERLNRTVSDYLIEQGLTDKQFTITSGLPTAEDPRQGYAIHSEMKLD